jgi:Ser/Thr protein kinase RdoA (MazF antagonist)
LTTSQSETPLPGGIRHGQTVRVGDTVRKPAGPWTPTIHALLKHLSARGFPVPQPLGIDEKRREILSFIDGRASHWPWPDYLKTLDGIERVGAMLRRYHEVVADFAPASPCIWQDCESRPPIGNEIVCHGDFGPYNIIWRNSEIVGVIDWEFARPALPMRDLAWAALTAIPLRVDEGDPTIVFRPTLAEARLRLQSLLSAYGYSHRSEVIDAAIILREEMTDKITTRGTQGLEPWQALLAAGVPEGNARDNAWLIEHRNFLLT